uniref:PABS domain-containing protein n=1 Tax=Pseudo-nitzschia australis TaxID=44445 RepID=A0A7S4ALS0_9STRA|mmetsp:Transcript_24164/g.52941  ORF Transcript_24164/g.52941 Transcript_24164/m.52941 type:complete len:674 (-) Transcript_24164:577-2598(-)|eukprot:CAMPEP_0168195194 /NCGR_PEP_ID=MMETSP0139_2-20121125/19698_1 /TAXON_ID=44445 /ORGANISM="Pseudo-nitzschia australis, Strain 10249 10 AB" /LENGTH=673 /DNA_ID=CAMNT_0008118977 /DNA_START=143 /DNA_END=2164 /DNA_ORIENTATION=-
MTLQDGKSNNAKSSRNISNGNGVAVNGDNDSNPYRVKVSLRFIALSMLSCWLLSFAVGRIARELLIVGPQQRMIELEAAIELHGLQLHQERKAGRKDVLKLPNPTLKNKPVPNTIYTSMNFDTARSASINSRWVVTEEDEDENSRVCKTSMSGKKDCEETSGTNPTSQQQSIDGIDTEDEVHLPAGQHLLMDIRNVQAEFLASEERLAQAMLDVVGGCGLTLLSYHCHGLFPNGVSCVGVLLESHVSFHTWPSQGVVTLDLFTCGSQSLLPIVERVESLFGIPKNGNADGPETVWAYKVRGFGDETQEELTDLFTFPIGTMTEYKKELVSIEKTSQNKNRIDVYDVLRPLYQNYEQYKRSLRDDGSYESRHKDFFRPDRIMFVNGVLQSRRSAEIPYHEALVHPAMVTHKAPSRILLLNCGGGAGLREVLKHKGVKRVVMIEEEPEVLKVSKKFFPEYHDCTSIQGVTQNCMDDPRVELIYGDLYDWTETRYDEKIDEEFDVIILDDLYYVDDFKEDEEDQKFALLLSKLLVSDGIFAAQVGDAPTLNTAASGNPEFQGRFDFIDSLQKNGFVRIIDYEEGHLGFSDPWQFMIAFKTGEPNETWDYTYSSWHNMHVDQRMLPSTGIGDSPLLHFDGAVMKGYSYPSKASGVVFCRGYPESPFCKEGRGVETQR